MKSPELNLIVIRSDNLEKSVGFFSLLGLKFSEEKHDKGPTHYSTQLGQLVLELYPLGNRNSTTDVRLGFVVASVDESLNQLESESVVRQAEDTERGRLAVVRDPDGHTIELLQITQ